MIENTNLPICIDLDGTLVQEETLWILLKTLFHRSWWMGGYVLLVLCFRGKAAFKQALASKSTLEPETLSYHPQLLSDLKRYAAQGKTLVLATGADFRVALKISQHLGLFKFVIASQGSLNRVGKLKAAALVNVFGSNRFIYAGNSWQDIPVWEEAAHIILVNTPPKLKQWIKQHKHRKKRLKTY